VVSCGHAAQRGVGGGVRPAAGPERGSAGSSSARAGERRECGGARYGKMAGGLARENKKKGKRNGPGPRQ
jgi:hypothetical protein